MQSFIVLASLVFELAGGGGVKMTSLSPLRYKKHLSPLTINNYSLYIMLEAIVCFLDQYSMIKYAFLFIISYINH